MLANPNYQNLSNSHQTEAVSKILDNLELISSSNPSLYNNIQSILDEVNLSSSIASLNEQILYFAPDYNSTIGINTSNIIFLKIILNLIHQKNLLMHSSQKVILLKKII